MLILLIDDDDLVRDMLRTTLVEAGHEVIGAKNGDEGLTVLEGQPVQLVITDILMPEKEGVETIIEIRKKQPNLAIVAISGGGRSKNFSPLKIARRAGANFVLPKPFEPDDLLDLVAQVAEKVRAPAGARRDPSR